MDKATEDQIRVIANQEARRVLAAYLRRQAEQERQRAEEDERIHEEALLAAYGDHGQG